MIKLQKRINIAQIPKLYFSLLGHQLGVLINPAERNQNLPLNILPRALQIVQKKSDILLVDTILRDSEFKSWISAHVLTANDLVAAWGGVKWMQENDLTLDVIAGPATDNAVGMRYVRDELGVGASNARTRSAEFVTLVEQAAFSRSGAPQP